MDRLSEIADELEKMNRELDAADPARRREMIQQASTLTEEMAKLLQQRRAIVLPPRFMPP